MDNEKKSDIYCVRLPNGSSAYCRVDADGVVYGFDGKPKPIGAGKLLDFLHMANILGLKGGTA